MPAIYLAPESPWWLVRRGRLDQARRELQRLTSARNVHFDPEKNISLMLVTTEHERAVDAATSYWACFRGVNARRTVIAIGIYCIQTLSGNPLRAYSTYFLQQAGMPTTQAFNMAIIGYGVAIGGGFFSVRFSCLLLLASARFGRHTNTDYQTCSGFFYRSSADERFISGACA